MTNDEAKRLYKEALERFKDKDYDGSLSLLERLDAERPNSRHVNYHRALCLVELGRIEEADVCYQKLVGRMEEDQLKRLAKAIEVSKGPRRSHFSASGIRQPKRTGDLSEMPEHEDTQPANVFVVQSVYPVSVNECSVMGHVKKGVFYTGDIASVISPTGDPTPAPIARIGPAETPLNLAREGQRVMMLLRVDPALVGAGASILCEARQTASAQTMIAPAARSRKEPTLAERPTELMTVERLIRQGACSEAVEKLDAYLDEHPESLPARRLLAQAYLEPNSPIHDPAKALELIRRVYESGGADDPSVTHTLAQALAENDDPATGLRFLERLHETTQSVEARQALAQRINAFRAKYGLGDIWEFGDEYGEVLFESSDSVEIVRALAKGSIPRDCQCRRNRVGSWGPIEGELASACPEVAALYKPEEPRRNTGFIIAFIILVLGILIALFLPQMVTLWTSSQ